MGMGKFTWEWGWGWGIFLRGRGGDGENMMGMGWGWGQFYLPCHSLQPTQFVLGEVNLLAGLSWCQTCTSVSVKTV